MNRDVWRGLQSGVVGWARPTMLRTTYFFAPREDFYAEGFGESTERKSKPGIGRKGRNSPFPGFAF
jgi:hypothetical protein